MLNDELLIMNENTRIRFAILSGLILAVLVACRPQAPKNDQNQLSPEEKKAGWVLLFDGKTFDGWRGLGRDSVMTDFWKVDNGTIHKIDNKLVPPRANGQKVNGGDLMTKETFENFELTFEWMIKDAGNSGIKYNVSEEISKAHGSGFNALSFEYQILDDDDSLYVGKIKPCQFTASLYDMIPRNGGKLNPAGQYNSGKIVLNGNHGEHWLNGEKVVEFEFGTAKFDSLFKASKYANYPDFEKRRAGHIVITNHSDESWYRNIKIRKL
jgi:hypothetical protein